MQYYNYLSFLDIYKKSVMKLTELRNFAQVRLKLQISLEFEMKTSEIIQIQYSDLYF